MGYLIENSGAIKKIVMIIKESEMQTLNSSPVTIIAPNGSTITCILAAFITGAPGLNSGAYTFNNLRIGDSATLFQCMLDLQQMNSSGLGTGGGFIFQPGTYVNFATGGKHDKSRPINLSSNADDLSGTGDFELTLFYYDLATQ
jgi:hypothetical protein